VSRHVRPLLRVAALVLAVAASWPAPAGATCAGVGPNPRGWRVERWLARLSPPADSALKRSRAEGVAYLDSLLRLSRATNDRALAAAVHAFRGKRYANRYALKTGAADLDTAWALSLAIRDSSGLARVLVARSHGEMLLGDNDPARRDAEMLVALADRARLPALAGLGHRVLGYLDKNAGNYPAARRHLRASIRLLPSGKFEQLHSRFLLAEVENRLGHPDEARDQFLALLEAGRNAGEPTIVAICLTDLGSLEYAGGDMALADQYWARAAALYDSTNGTPSAINVRCNRAHALRILGKTDEARAVLDETLRLSAQVQDPAPRLAAWREVALLDQRLGRTARADTLFRRVIAGSGDDTELAEGTSIDLATLLRETNRPREGKAVIDSLFATRLATMMPAYVADARQERSACLRALGRPAEALADARLADRELRREHETSVDGLAAALELARCHRDLGRPDSAALVLRDAARQWERWRGGISDLEWRERSGSGLAGLFSEYGLALLDGRRGGTPARRAREAFDALQVFQARTLEERMHGSGLAGAAMRARVTADSLRRGVLREGELLVDVVTSPDTSLAFLVTRGGVAVCGLPGADRLARLGSDWRDATLAGAGAAVVAAGLERLSNVLLVPMAGAVRGSRAVIVSGGGPLALWPIAALTVPAESAPLGATRELSTVPSATLLAALRARRDASPAGPLLAVGRTTDAEGRELPGAARELQTLGSRYAGAVVRVHHGERTVPDLTRDLARWNVLHFAAETEVRPGNPWRSGMLLGRGAGDDAFLRASRVAGMRLGARLAVLSGCQSAGATTLSGEGAIGLAGAFLCAGTSSVVATLWPVEDRVAQRFTEAFYAQLAAGRTVAAAVSGAQRELRARPETADVRDWAAFVASGEAGTRVRLAPRNAR
jgi:tetratricopeptide (TPR) repeat protein